MYVAHTRHVDEYTCKLCAAALGMQPMYKRARRVNPMVGCLIISIGPDVGHLASMPAMHI